MSKGRDFKNTGIKEQGRTGFMSLTGVSPQSVKSEEYSRKAATEPSRKAVTEPSRKYTFSSIYGYQASIPASVYDNPKNSFLA